MDYLIYSLIGLTMGVFGGLLGIGGSAVMIPALVVIFGENQHLYQASAMICNFFVSASASIVHKNAKVLVPEVLRWLVPGAAIGIIAGVAISNSSIFARENSYLLARIFGIFNIYVIVYNCLKFRHKPRGGIDGMDISGIRKSRFLSLICGLAMGIFAGILGIGGGTICIPAQQLLLKMPLKVAICNSAATIAAVALIGAFYKNATLFEHGVELLASVKIAACVIPCAIIGAFVGGKLMHKLHANVVRVIFILLIAIASYKLLTVPAGV